MNSDSDLQAIMQRNQETMTRFTSSLFRLAPSCFHVQGRGCFISGFDDNGALKPFQYVSEKVVIGGIPALKNLVDDYDPMIEAIVVIDISEGEQKEAEIRKLNFSKTALEVAYNKPEADRVLPDLGTLVDQQVSSTPIVLSLKEFVIGIVKDDAERYTLLSVSCLQPTVECEKPIEIPSGGITALIVVMPSEGRTVQDIVARAGAEGVQLQAAPGENRDLPPDVVPLVFLGFKPASDLPIQ